MTALEYMTKQLNRHRLNLERETKRGVPEEMLRNIEAKVGYYAEAVEALGEYAADVVEVVRCEDCVYEDMTSCPLCYIEKHTLQFVNHDGAFYCAKGKRKDGEGE